jgi:hypothetical protein
VIAESAVEGTAAFASRRAMLEQLYRDFNARDIEAVLEHLAPDVDWPNGMTGGRVQGRAAVRQYWTNQWREVDSRVEPMKIEPASDGAIHVLVDQLVRSLDRKILSNKQVMHVYEFDGAFITRMTIVDFDRPADDEEDDD